MSKGSVVFVGDNLKYEAETLTVLTEATTIAVARAELWDFAVNKWGWDEEKEDYKISTLATRRERAIFNNLYLKVLAILASDKNGVFESVGTLFDLARNSPDDFTKIYQLAVKANPTLNTEKDKQKEPDPKNE